MDLVLVYVVSKIFLYCQTKEINALYVKNVFFLTMKKNKIQNVAITLQELAIDVSFKNDR